MAAMLRDERSQGRAGWISVGSAITGGAALVGSTAWGAYLARLLSRSLHMLQQEGYQTARFLAWTASKRERWGPTPRLATGIGMVALGAVDAALGGRLTSSPLAPAAWSALGGWRWREAAPGPAAKPLAWTARMKRLAAGASALALGLAAGPAFGLALRGGAARRYVLPALVIGGGAASLAMPGVVAGANVLLWPVEEAFRRYYLADARRVLRRCRPTVVAVAGSYGKTSTKEFTAAILGARWSVLKPPGSYNTPMGLCRIVRERLEPSHDLFVAELGDYQPGEIRDLCRLVGPRVGILTTIGPEHLERFKTMERIVQAKEELPDALPPDGILVANQDDPLIRPIADRAERRGLRVIRYGQRAAGAQIRAQDVRTTRDGLRFTVEADRHGTAVFQVGLLGRHNVMNVLAATGAALVLGMSIEEIAAAASTIEPVEHRLQPIRGVGGVLVIDDTYNSNPRGAAEALTVLGEIEGGKKVFVTPGMIELAERENDEHRALGRHAAEVADYVILVGPERTRPIRAGLLEAGFPEERILVVRSRDEATGALRGLLAAGDVVLWENDLPDTFVESPPPPLEPPPLSTAALARGSGGDEADGSPRVKGGVAGTHERTATAVGARTAVTSDGVRYAVVDGLRIAYRVEGPVGLPPGALPVVVLHGWGASIAAVRPIQAGLRASHRTIALDLPGFGESDPPATVWGSVEYAALVRAFLAHLGIERVSLIGHSHGGRVSIVLASSYPSLVDKLVLVDSAGLRPTHGLRYRARVYAYKAGRRALASPLLAGRPGAVLGGWFGRRFGSADFQAASGVMRGTLVRVVNEDHRARLPKVAAPTLLIWGENDAETPISDGTLMESMIPDAGLVVFPGAGHYSYADDLGRFCRIVGHFLQS